MPTVAAVVAPLLLAAAARRDRAVSCADLTVLDTRLHPNSTHPPRGAVRDAVARLACCSECRTADLQSNWWKGAFSSQMNVMLDKLIVHLLAGARPDVGSRARIAPFTQGRERPQQWVNDTRCPSQTMACLFEPPGAVCATRTARAARARDGPAALLHRAHPYDLAAESSRLLLTPNDWFERRVTAISRALHEALGVGDGGFVGVHVRRGDKLLEASRSKERVALPPASAIARRVAALAASHGVGAAAIMSDDDEVAVDVAALLPHIKIAALQMPHMSLARGEASERARRAKVPAAARGGGAADAAADAPCGMPAYAGHAALPSCAELVARTLPDPGGVRRPAVVDVPSALAAFGAPAAPGDLGAMVMGSVLAIARGARALLGSSRSNVAVLIFTLAGAIGPCRDYSAFPYFYDIEEDGDAPPRAARCGAGGDACRTAVANAFLRMRDLTEGRYFCLLAWGARKGLCAAGQRSRDAKGL